MMTVISIVLFIAAVAPVIILLCMPEHGIGTGEKDPRPWPEILGTALLRLAAGAFLLWLLDLFFGK
jgi:hypothetical protein